MVLGELGDLDAGMWIDSLGPPETSSLVFSLFSVMPSLPQTFVCGRVLPCVNGAPSDSPLPTIPGECGSARREHAGLLPATLPDLLPAPAGEAASAEEGRQQAVP